MKKVLTLIISILLMYTISVKAQVITVQTEFSLDIDYRSIESVLLLVKDSTGEEHVIKTEYDNNYKVHTTIADGPYEILSYTVRKDYTLNYPIELKVDKTVYPNLITMKVSHKSSSTTTTTTKGGNTTTSTTTKYSGIETTDVIYDKTTTTRKNEETKKEKKTNLYTIILIGIPVVLFILFLIYGVIKFLTTIR